MKVYRIYDVNGEPTGLETKDADEAEMFADRGSCGDHVVEVDTVKEAAEDLLAALRLAVRCYDNHEDDRNDWVAMGRDAIEKAEGQR